jgi:hypothetical protein
MRRGFMLDLRMRPGSDLAAMAEALLSLRMSLAVAADRGLSHTPEFEWVKHWSRNFYAINNLVQALVAQRIMGTRLKLKLAATGCTRLHDLRRALAEAHEAGFAGRRACSDSHCWPGAGQQGPRHRCAVRRRER